VAHSLGKPVICTDVGSFSEVTGEGKGGIIVPPKNPKALAEALTRLLGNRSLSQRMGEEGKRHTLIRYSWENIAKVYMAAYESAAKKQIS